MVKKLIREIFIMELTKSEGRSYMANLFDVVANLDDLTPKAEEIQLFLVMEYVPGFNLKEFLDRA